MVVEDEFFAAEQLSRDIGILGDTVIGPFANLEDAMSNVTRAHADAAILDARLCDRTSFDIADRLKQQDVPFVFLTGYGLQAIPPRFRQQPIYSKPSSTRSLLRQLHGHRLRAGETDMVQDVLVDMLSYVRLVGSDSGAAERLVEKVMVQAINAIEGGAIVGDLRAMMIALMDHEIAQNLPGHFH